MFYTVELAIEADYPYFEEKGSSKIAVVNEVLTIMNEVNLQYEAEADITFQISVFVIHETPESDPYDPSDQFDLLEQMKGGWAATYVTYANDAAQVCNVHHLPGYEVTVMS